MEEGAASPKWTGVAWQKWKGKIQGVQFREMVEWNTSYEQEGKTYSYKIKGSAQTLDDFEIF